MTLQVQLEQAGPIPLRVAFECAPGEMLAVVGPSGSGKTTVLRAIAGLYAPAQGEVRVGGTTWLATARAIDVPAHERAVGLVFQSYALFPHMTALENVACALLSLPHAERRPRALEALAAVRLSGLEQRRPSELSGGQQQRVAVARAIVRNPQVLLLDEPFSAVDRSTRRRLYLEIAELRASLRMPVVLVTHDLEEAAMLADRVAVIHRGETLQTGSVREVMSRPRTPEVARLVDLRNVFEGTILEPGAAGGRTSLAWGSLRLDCAEEAPGPAGRRVAWTIPDGFIVLHRRDRPSRGEHENPVHGTVESIVTVGENALVTLRTAEDRLPLHFTIPAHVARRNDLAKGAQAAVSLLADGIQLMPPD
jgi:molybdate transport system ATP-binding protein